MKIGKVNGVIADLTRSYQDQIPLGSIFTALHDAGLFPVQEDGTPWSGMLCGREGRAEINLVDANKRPVPHRLILSWYRFETTNRYETVSYIS